MVVRAAVRTLRRLGVGVDVTLTVAGASASVYGVDQRWPGRPPVRVGIWSAALLLVAAARRPRHGTPQGPSSALSRRGDDPELMDLAVDRGPGHAQRLRGLRLVAVGVQQALRDGVALDRLQRAEEPPAEGPGLGG